MKQSGGKTRPELSRSPERSEWGSRRIRIGTSAISFAIALATIGGTAPPAHAQLATSAWPMFHHGLTHTGLSPYDTSANDGKLKWSYATGDSVYSPTIGADGTIYFGSPDHSVYALNPDGTKKWSYATGDWVNYSTPAIGADGTIYVGSYDHNVYALNPDGTKKWSYATAGSISPSPAIGADGTIYVGSDDGNVYVLNPDGTKKWSYATAGQVYSSPAIGADGTIYVGSFDHSVYALNSDGTKKWSYATGGDVFSSPAVGADGTIYVGSDDGNVYALNPDGTKRWSYASGSLVGSSPAVGADGTIYVGSLDNNVYALNPDGTKKWSYTTGDIVTSSPAIGADGTIYVGSFDGHVYAIGIASPTPTTSVGLSSSLSFGNLALGDTLTKPVTIKNTGAHPLFINGVTSSDSAEFPPGASTCPVGGLAPGATCTTSVTFHPNTLGPLSATITLTDNANTGTQTVAVSGTGIADLTTSVASLSWGNVPFGYSIPLANFCANGLCLYNHQNVPVNLSEGITGPNAADFKVTGGSCGATLGAAISGTTPTPCSLAVTFTPGALGSESATLNISDSPDASSPYHIPLNAAGTIPDTIWPLSLAYGNVSQAASQTLTAYVINNSPLTISLSDGISGPNAGDFTITGGTCGAALAGKTTCTILVKFKPTSAAPESATLGIGVNQDPTSPHNVALSGTGT